MERDGFPKYNFWDDLKRLGRAAIQFVTITPFDARGYRSDHVRVETETHAGQLFVGDTLESGGEARPPIKGLPIMGDPTPTEELDLNEIHAEMWENTPGGIPSPSAESREGFGYQYTHNFEGVTRDARTE